MNQAYHTMRIVTAVLVSLSLFGSLPAEDKPNTKPDEKSVAEKLAARRLEFMKNSVKDYEFLLGPDFKAKLTVEPEPLLRFTNPVSGLQDGGFFLWKDDKPVWEVAWRKPPFDPKEPFFILVYSRELSLKKLFPFSK